MTFLGVVVLRDNQNTVFFPTAPENRDYLRRGGALTQGREQRFGLRVIPKHNVAHFGVGEAADGHGLRL